MRSIASRIQSRKSVETWSLRLRPVCSLRPTSPIRSTRARSMFMCTSSSSWRKTNLPASISRRISVKPRDDLLRLGGGQHPWRGQHPGMGDRAPDILRVEPAVEADALGELFHAGIGCPVKDATPRFVCHRHSQKIGTPNNTGKLPRGQSVRRDLPFSSHRTRHKQTENARQHLYTKWFRALSQSSAGTERTETRHQTAGPPVRGFSLSCTNYPSCESPRWLRPDIGGPRSDFRTAQASVFEPQW